jgi:hypothetical protein
VRHPAQIEKRFLMRRLETGEVCSFDELMLDLPRHALVGSTNLMHLPEPFCTYWESSRPESW